jgi:hypothetical protein
MARVVVSVTLPGADAEHSDDVPGDVLALVAATPQVQRHGWSKRGSSPWRAQFLVRGPDCIATAQSLEQGLRDLGYEADATFG